MASTNNMHGYYTHTYTMPSQMAMDSDAMYRKSSPISTTSTASSHGSPAPAGGWSPNVESDGSEFVSSSPPASDDGFPPTHPSHFSVHQGSADWDLLSEMLIDDAVPSHAQFVGGTMGYTNMYGAPPPTARHPFNHQQQHQHAYNQQPTMHQFQQNQPFQQPRRTAVHTSSSSTTGFMDSLLLQEDAMVHANAKSSAVGSPQTTDLFPPMPPLPLHPQDPSSSCSSSESDSSPSQSPHATASRKTTANKPKPTATVVVKSEPLSAEEAKKLRRRSQIASSVQRHREKKKCLVASLKDDLASLTHQLTTLRSQRKQLHANNDRLVEWEEEAITQRRKRKQSEELNQRMKKALFQQTSFLMGMRSIMTNVPAPREMHIHDYLHAYTVLTAKGDRTARQREYQAYFPDTKVDMACQIVMRETDHFASRLTLSNPYFSEIKILHDGTEAMHHEHDVTVERELHEPSWTVVPGTGQVVKKYTSMFLFEERGNCTMEAFQHVALAATKAVGVFWPSPGYTAQALDTCTLEDGSELIFSDLHGSMAMVDDQQTTDATQDVQLEARMLCRVKHTEDGTIIAWDYADKDELYPIQGEQSIRRDSCGAALVRREPGGKISFRSVCVKMFGPLDSNETVSNETKALTMRRISLQASEIERANQKCTRSVYESLAGAFAKIVV